MNRQTITVDIAPGNSQVQRLSSAQGDIGRPLGVYIIQDGVALDCSGYTAELYILKSDGNYFEGTATVDSQTNNLITWETAEQETPCAGVCAAQIRISANGEDIGTARFVEYVEASPGFVGEGSESTIDTIKGFVRQAEAWATGEKDGIPVPSTDPTYENNAKYYAEQSKQDYDDLSAEINDISEDVADLKSAINSITYGIDITPSYTVGANNKFSILLVEGQTYTVKNNTTKGSNVVLVRNDGTTKIITGNLASGASISFTADEDDYTAIQMYINADTTGTINISAEISVYERIGDLETNADNNNSDILRLFNSFNDLLYGATYSFTGTVSSINKFSMPLFEGFKYTATNNTGAKIGIDLFKADGTSKQISSSLANGASIEFTVDAKDYAQIGGWFNAGSTGTLSVTCGFSIFDKLDDIESAVGDHTEEISDLTETVGDMTKTQNILRTDYVKKAGYFFNTNNQDYAANQWDYYTLSVKQGEQYAIDTKAGQSARAWIFRNSSQAIISMDSYSDTPVQATYNVTVPENAVEMIMNGQPSGTFSIIQKNGETINEDKIIYKNKSLPKYLDDIDGKTGNILAGKILCCCGDSITYGADMPQDGIVTPTIGSYQYSAYTKKWTRWTAEEPAAYGYQIAARNGMIFYNGGVSGACVQGSGGTSTVPGFSVTDGEYTLLPDNIDYLTLFFGWNDTAFGSLGTINDTTNDSYYGAYNVVLPYLINKYPYTKIAIIVPFGTDVGHRQAVRDLANKWGIACFDLYKEGAPLYYGKEPDINVEQSIITSNRAKFQANGAHPNFQGHYLISTMLEAFLRGI